MQTVYQKCMGAWNSGLTSEEAVALYGQNVESIFQSLEKVFGDSAIPVHILYGFTTPPITDPLRLQHLGLIGAGAELKRVIAISNSQRLSEPLSDLLKGNK